MYQYKFRFYRAVIKWTKVIIRQKTKLKYQKLPYQPMQPKKQIIEEASFQLTKRPFYLTSNSSLHPKKSIYPFIVCIVYLNKLKKNAKKRRYRDKILQEWYNTEQSYRFDLIMAKDYIKRPMESIKNISYQHIQVLFPEIDNMVALSGKMISVLFRAIQMRSHYEIRLGKQINQFVKQYKIYGNYFATHSKRLQILHNLLQSSQLQLKQIQTTMQSEYLKKNSNKQGMTIKDVMDNPHSRLFKYVILLKQYIKKMPKYHPDYQQSVHCLSLFHDINNYNNQLMKKLEESQKKIRLYNIFGERVRKCGDYVNQMEVKTIYNDAKVYIFKSLVLVTQIISNLGSQKQQKLGLFQINQFSFVSSQADIKYFKNIAILISKQQCIHFFFAQQQTRNQFISIMQKLIKQNNHHRYQLIKTQKYIPGPIANNSTSASTSTRASINTNTNTNTINYPQMFKKSSDTSGSSRQIKFSIMEPQLRVEVVGFDVRAFGTLSTHTVYVIRFMIPYYYDDQIYFIDDAEQNDMFNAKISNKKHLMFNSSNSNNPSVRSGDSEKSRKTPKIYCLNQRIQMSLNLVEQLYIYMQTLCPDRIPEIDPISRDINVSFQGKTKTKTFEVRKFLVQQFFNFSLRAPSVLTTPMWFLSKMRMNEEMWSFIVRRNAQIKQSKSSILSYGYDHCNICKHGRIRTIQQFQNLRTYFNLTQAQINSVDEQNYCFNLLNLLKMRLLSFNGSNFNTIQRILTYYHYMQGRLDYPFIGHANRQKNMKIIKINLASVEDKFIEVTIDSKTTVGQALQQLGKSIQLQSVFDFDLIMVYHGKSRILDRDEYLIDIVKMMGLAFEQCSIKNNKIKKKSTLISTLRQWSNNLLQQPQHKLILLKTTYLTKSLQLKSFLSHPYKLDIEIQKIFWIIKRGLVKLTLSQFTQNIAILYCIKEYEGMNTNSNQAWRTSGKFIEMYIPDQYMHIYHYQPEFKRDLALAIDRQRAIVRGGKYCKQDMYCRIIDFAFDKIGFRTYFIEVQPKQIPVKMIGNNQIPNHCLLGVNSKNLVMSRNQSNASVLLVLPLADIEFQITVFSIYVYYDTQTLRFDGKMLYQFGQLIRKYQTIMSKFPQHLG